MVRKSNKKSMKTIKEVKKALGLSNDDIARYFGYKSRSSYENSTAKPRIEKGIIRLYNRIKQQ